MNLEEYTLAFVNRYVQLSNDVFQKDHDRNMNNNEESLIREYAIEAANSYYYDEANPMNPEEAAELDISYVK